MGRLAGVSVMFAGVGIIGALASILASFLVSLPSDGDQARASDAASASVATPPVTSALPSDVAAELARLSGEVAALRQQLAVNAD